ncbi:hypothetical protein [Beijerinckia mobilis]|uniref:hypothetical protein n=1 Tax=Beijerinckia mobilis TaxID=231434 RepID=UPI0012EB5369|nr:hypothetical protein [Beijerinckia mobilis]
MAATLILGCIFGEAHGEQTLLPVPYPNMLGNEAHIGRSPRLGQHQELIDEPVPQSLGPNALGNPEGNRRAKHQHLKRSPYWRHYRPWH